MIKRTLYFGNPAYLKTKHEQIVIYLVDTGEEKTVPVEDTGILILDNPQITISQGLLAKLIENNVAVVSCDSKHLPSGLFLPLEGHVLQTARFKHQIDASEPLKKMLWQQTIQSKINNQAALLEQIGVPAKNMRLWAREVRSGDPENYEARAAAYYWRNIFGSDSKFLRDRFGEPPNNILNYAYAILRAITARALTGSGLLPTLGIHHRNQYNAYCLADDIMEPYRPMADALVKEILEDDTPLMKLEPTVKRRLLELPVRDVEIGGQSSPLMVAMSRTTSSLAGCFERKMKKIVYPEFLS
jgi:CRISPR-associated protein Cas1